MSKNKNSVGEQSSALKDEALPRSKEIQTSETERRLTTLEKTAVDLNNRIFDSHKWFVTVLFSVVAVVLTVYGVLSRLDVRDSTKEMEKRVEAATTEMEKKFAMLSGEALKKPLLQVSVAQGPLDGQVFEIPVDNRGIPFFPLFFKNTGDKRTEPLSLQLSATFDLFNGNSDWSRTATDDTNYPFSYYSREVISSRTAGGGIAP